MKPFKFTVKVPGTSANLGSGFDIMGLALNVYNEFFFEITDSGGREVFMLDGSKLPFGDNEDLVYQALERYFSLYLPGKTIPGYRLALKLGLPLRGGLGSSASALVAGFFAAGKIHEKFFGEISLPQQRELLYELAMMEGHPDNTTPAYTGGLVFAYFSGNSIEYYKHKFPGSMALYVFTPDLQMCTNTSRKALPSAYESGDVIFNMARIAAWYEFLAGGKPGHLQRALEDRLHTPYRIQPESAIAEVIAAIKNHITGYSLSGSGPTLLLYVQRKHALLKEKKIRLVLEEIMKKRKLEYSFYRVKPDNHGVI